MKELPPGLKIANVWLLVGTALFLAVQAWLARRAQPQWALQGTALVLQRGADGHFHWPGRVDGRAVDFLVDTGATRSALPGALAQELGLKPLRALRSATAGGVAQGFEAQVELALEGGFEVQRMRVAVLPELHTPLLGMDVLGRLRFSQQDGRLRIEGSAE
jgi:aspartyl protease family protein